MAKIILVLLGGALGSLVRYSVSEFMQKYSDGTFPLGTLIVNLAGCLLIGLIWGIAEQGNISVNLRTFIFIGLLGGFTTFSAFSVETMNLFRDNEIRLGIINILANNVLGILLTVGGFVLISRIYQYIK